MTKEERNHGKTSAVKDSVGGLRWWREPAYVTAVAALIAGIMPVTALVNRLYKMRLEREVQLEEVRSTYLDRAIDPERSTEYRESVLKFLVATLRPGDPMKSWANERLATTQRVLQLRSEIGRKEKELARLSQRLKSEAKKSKEASHQVESLNDELRALQSKLESLEISPYGRAEATSNADFSVTIVYRNDQGVEEEYQRMVKKSQQIASILSAIDFHVRIEDWLGFREDGDPSMSIWMEKPSVWYRSGHTPTADAAGKIQRLLEAVSSKTRFGLRTGPLRSRWSEPGPYSIQIWVF